MHIAENSLTHWRFNKKMMEEGLTRIIRPFRFLADTTWNLRSRLFRCTYILMFTLVACAARGFFYGPAPIRIPIHALHMAIDVLRRQLRKSVRQTSITWQCLQGSQRPCCFCNYLQLGFAEKCLHFLARAKDADACNCAMARSS